MESKILETIGIDPGYIIIGLLVLWVIIFMMLLFVMANHKKRNKELSRLLSGTTASDLEGIIMKRFAEMDTVKNNSIRITREHVEILDTLEGCINKMGLVKYNAFEGMGGSLSFALALLDSKNNGVVLNCMHTREGCFAYAKEIIRGESYVVLSDEEKEAMERAKTLDEEVAEMLGENEE